MIHACTSEEFRRRIAIRSSLQRLEPIVLGIVLVSIGVLFDEPGRKRTQELITMVLRRGFGRILGVRDSFFQS